MGKGTPRTVLTAFCWRRRRPPTAPRRRAATAASTSSQVDRSVERDPARRRSAARSQRRPGPLPTGASRRIGLVWRRAYPKGANMELLAALISPATVVKRANCPVMGRARRAVPIQFERRRRGGWRPARLRCRQEDQGTQAPHRHRHHRAVGRGDRPCRRHSGS